MIYERKINYYETDKMGVVHHTNYIRFMEEARIEMLNEIGLPFDMLEANGITIPTLSVNVEYKYHVTFADTIKINVFAKEYNGVRMTIGYEILNKDGKLILVGETKHCFTNFNLKPINLKKVNLEFSKKFENLGGNNGSIN